MTHTHDTRLLTGVAGLDQILHGGLIPHRTYLIRGGPGSGKTTLGMHFLVAESPFESLLVSLARISHRV
ncbi:ATPase domain-containing protein [Halomonas sp. CSM-2]|uniref:ATPase domain-containing protein n=1 Tax=Halomonas sp. CSM-2 TaxID=1975722 RepID=UPI001C38DDD9|nr:ATPase domain-containing protein [Halomonas sp. CSM-2]